MGTEECGGGGDCLFHVFAKGLPPSSQTGKARTHEDTRAKCATYLTKHRAEMEPFYDGKAPTAGEEELGEGYDAYLKRIVKKGAWGGALEVTALARAYDAPTVVISDSMPPVVANRKGKHPPIYMRLSDKHYQLLKGTISFDCRKEQACAPLKGHEGW